MLYMILISISLSVYKYTYTHALFRFDAGRTYSVL